MAKAAARNGSAICQQSQSADQACSHAQHDEHFIKAGITHMTAVQSSEHAAGGALRIHEPFERISEAWSIQVAERLLGAGKRQICKPMT